MNLIENFTFKGIKKKRKSRPTTIVILTTRLGKKSIAPTAEKIKNICKDRGIRCLIIDTEKGSIQKTQKDSFLISSNNEKQHEIHLGRTIILTRRSSIKNNAAKGFFQKLEDLGFPCVNSYDSVILCEDKFQTTRKLELNEIPVPNTSLLSNVSGIDAAVKEIGGQYPVVCKFLSGTKGIGVFLIDSRPSLISTLQAIWHLSPQTEVLIQEKIDAEYDLRIHVIAESDRIAGREYKVLATMKRDKIDGDFRTNYSLGGSTDNYELTPELEKIAIESAKATGCLWCGVDIIISEEGEPFVLEVNASPGTTGIEKTTGIEVTDVIIDFLLNKKNWVKPKKESGFREMITIDGIGNFVAKLDTGNGATSCSLHADNVKEEDGYVKWTIDGKEYKNQIIGTSRAEVGEKIHNRSVINLDVDYGGRVFKNVKFSLVDRGEKSTPVLLNRYFLSRAGIIVNPAEDFISSERPDGYSPRIAKKDPLAGIKIFTDSIGEDIEI